MGAAPGIPTWFWSTGGLHEGQEPFVTWASALANTSTPPFVVSVSYGDPENTVTLDYAKRLDVEFKKLYVLDKPLVLLSSSLVRHFSC